MLLVTTLLAVAFIVCALAISPSDNLCIGSKCEEGMVCVQRPGGSTCMAVDPSNNCNTLKCNRGSTCSYQETECIPDKACFAEPTCKRSGSKGKSPGTKPAGVRASSPQASIGAVPPPPCLLDCPVGQVCTLRTDDNSCYNPPCPPVPKCDKPSVSPSLPKIKPVPGVCNLFCVRNTRCVLTSTGPKCLPSPTCAEMRCPVGQTCKQDDKNSAPSCVPLQPDCGRNEEVSNCGALCENKCQNLGKGPIPCPLICLPPACACKDGFYRDTSGQCVTPSQCLKPCGTDEELRQCGSFCQPRCPSRFRELIACPTNCGPPDCVCKKPLVRLGSKCVQPSMCPPITPVATNVEEKTSYVDEPGVPGSATIANKPSQGRECSSKEVINQCGNLCEPTCENANGEPRICLAICNPPACVCAGGLFRHNGECVTKQQCLAEGGGYGRQPRAAANNGDSMTGYGDEAVVPLDPCFSFSCPEGQSCIQDESGARCESNLPEHHCTSNETVSNCGALCEGKCSQLGKGMFICPNVCLPPACACKEGYYRSEEGECVSQRDCPLNCGENEQVDQCGNRCEPTCENAFGQVKVCVLICDPPACACKPNFFRKDGKCVSQRQCPAPKKGENSQNNYGDDPVTPPTPTARTTKQSYVDEPITQCSANETIEECGNICEDSCDNYGKDSIVCPVCAPAACACRKGYYRNKDGMCVRIWDCPIAPSNSGKVNTRSYVDEPILPSPDAKSTSSAFAGNSNSGCSGNETLSECGNLCEGKCENLGKGPMACAAICEPAACACKDGYYRDNNGNCVAGIDCSLNCARNERVNPCGNLCEPTCENAFGKPKVCPRICRPAACVCITNYYRKDQTCVPQMACSVCGTDEVVNPCGSQCEPTCENAFGKEKACPRICRPPACVCKPGYYRQGTKCVSQLGCGLPAKPARTNLPRPSVGSSAGTTTSNMGSGSQRNKGLVCGQGEVVNMCGSQCELSCAQAFDPPQRCRQMCAKPACVCKSGYYRQGLTCIPQLGCGLAGAAPPKHMTSYGDEQTGALGMLRRGSDAKGARREAERDVCGDETCGEDQVCVEGEVGLYCMTRDPENNCDVTECPRGYECAYLETECIPDKPCYAEAVCMEEEQISGSSEGDQTQRRRRMERSATLTLSRRT